MATKLDRELVRESTVLVDDKIIIVSIMPDQSIEMKLKGVRGGVLKISLLELFEYLGGISTPIVEEDAVDVPINGKGGLKATPVKKSKDNEKMISLYDLRSENMISMLDLPTKVKFDAIIAELIRNLK